MECPRYGLLSPESARFCDCGYDFERRILTEYDLRERTDTGKKEAERHRTAHFGLTIGLLTACVLIAIFGGAAKGLWTFIILIWLEIRRFF
jgi:hypothetical protein